MRKGITQIISTLLLLLVVLTVSSIAYYFFISMQENVQGTVKNNTGILLTPEKFQIDNVNPENLKVSIKNTGSSGISNSTVRVYLDDAAVSCDGLKSIEPGKVSTCQLGSCPVQGSHTIKVTGRQAVSEKMFDIPAKYCIGVTIGPDIMTGKIKINGSAYRNDAVRTPYNNKIIELQLDPTSSTTTENVTTGGDGKFSLTREWNFSSLAPLSAWELPFSYEIVTPASSSGGPAAPEWNVKYDTTQASTNWITFKLNSSDKLLLRDRDIKPLLIEENKATFRISHIIETAGFSQTPNTKTWFGYTLDGMYGGGGLADPSVYIDSVSCSDTTDAKCMHGIVNITSTTSYTPKNFVSGERVDYNYTAMNAGIAPLVTRVHYQTNIYFVEGVSRYKINTLSTPYVTHGKNLTVGLNPGESADFNVNFGVDNVITMLTNYFGAGKNPTGVYLVSIEHRIPDWGESLIYNERFAFCINTAPCTAPADWRSNTDRTYIVVWNYTQDITSLPDAQIFSANVTFKRLASQDISVGSLSPEFFMFVEDKSKRLLYITQVPGAGDQNPWGEAWAFSHATGMPGDQYFSRAFFPIKIPRSGTAETSVPYLVARVNSFNFNPSSGIYTLDVNAKAYLVNYNKDHSSNNIIFYKKYGLFALQKEAVIDLPGPGGNNFGYEVPITRPAAGELREVWASYTIGNPSLTGDFLHPNLTVYINGQLFRKHFWNSETSYSNCVQNGADSCWYRLNWAWYSDISSFVPQDATILNITAASDPGSMHGNIGARAWIRYSITEPLWTNKGVHSIKFETLQNEVGVRAGKYLYSFEA